MTARPEPSPEAWNAAAAALNDPRAGWPVIRGFEVPVAPLARRFEDFAREAERAAVARVRDAVEPLLAKAMREAGFAGRCNGRDTAWEICAPLRQIRALLEKEAG